MFIITDFRVNFYVIIKITNNSRYHLNTNTEIHYPRLEVKVSSETADIFIRYQPGEG